MKKTFESLAILPIFTGFYDTDFDANNWVDYYEEDEISDEDYFKIDFKEYMQRIARTVCDIVAKEINDDFKMVEVSFNNLDSPRFYNFRNDRIYVDYKFDLSLVDAMIEYINDNMEAFEKAVKERFTPYDGYTPYASNKVEVWLNEYITKESAESDSSDWARALYFFFDFYFENEEFGVSDIIDHNEYVSERSTFYDLEESE